MQMRLAAIVAICILLLFALTSNSNSYAQFCTQYFVNGMYSGTDTLSCDTIRIGCPVYVNSSDIIEGDSIAVPVYYWADETLVGFALGFEHSSDHLQFTSVSFDGSYLESSTAIQAKIIKFEPSQNQVLLGGIDIASIGEPPPASGAELFCTLYLRMLPGAVAEAVDIDTSFVAPAGYFELGVKHGSRTHIVVPVIVDCGDCEIGLGEPCQSFNCGDFTGDGVVNIADAVYLINYVFNGGAAPLDPSGGDINCDGKVNITDAVVLVNYIFAGGPAPCTACP